LIHLNNVLVYFFRFSIKNKNQGDLFWAQAFGLFKGIWMRPILNKHKE